jgi:hypothetical protein
MRALTQRPDLQDRVGPWSRAGTEPLKRVVDDGQIGIEAVQLSDHRFPACLLASLLVLRVTRPTPCDRTRCLTITRIAATTLYKQPRRALPL